MSSISTPSEHADIKRRLLEIVEAKPDNITAFVAQEASEHDDPVSFLSDLVRHGCISGIVGSLIYYHDTHAFFDKHYYEIEEVRETWEEETGQAIQIDGDLKNSLAWFAAEYYAHALLAELDVEF